MGKSWKRRHHGGYFSRLRREVDQGNVWATRKVLQHLEKWQGRGLTLEQAADRLRLTPHQRRVLGLVDDAPRLVRKGEA